MASQTARYAGKPWWQMPIGSQNTSSPPTWGNWALTGTPLKGDYNGECQRIACDNRNSHWFNETNGKYYCASCARSFNDVCRRNGQPPLCVLRPGPSATP